MRVRDYTLRVWTGTVFIDSDKLGPGVSYMGDATGRGLQCDTHDAKDREALMDACEKVADAMRDMDGLIDKMGL